MGKKRPGNEAQVTGLSHSYALLVSVILIISQHLSFRMLWSLWCNWILSPWGEEHVKIPLLGYRKLQLQGCLAQNIACLLCTTYYTIWYNHEVIYFSFSFTYLFLCGWRKVLYATESLWRSKDNWQELVLSFHYVSLDYGQVIRPPSKLFDQPR